MGVPVRDYFPVVQSIYIPLRNEFEREVYETTQRINAAADARVLDINAHQERGITNQALLDIHAVNVQRGIDIQQVTRTLDSKRWEWYTYVLETIRNAAVFASRRDSESIGALIRTSGYGHQGFSASPRHPWDEMVYALLMRLYTSSLK